MAFATRLQSTADGCGCQPCALTLDRALVAYQSPPLLFISADDGLLEAAAAEGLATDDPNRFP